MQQHAARPIAPVSACMKQHTSILRDLQCWMNQCKSYANPSVLRCASTSTQAHCQQLHAGPACVGAGPGLLTEGERTDALRASSMPPESSLLAPPVPFCTQTDNAMQAMGHDRSGSSPVHSRTLLLVQAAAEGRFRARFSEHPILAGQQLLLPVGFFERRHLPQQEDVSHAHCSLPAADSCNQVAAPPTAGRRGNTATTSVNIADQVHGSLSLDLL